MLHGVGPIQPEAAPRESSIESSFESLWDLRDLWDLHEPAGLVVARQVEAGNGK